MAKNYQRIEDGRDSDGFVIPGYSRWDCEHCGREVRRYRGQGDVDCSDCGACYNAGGQRLRDDWRRNPSAYDNEIGDMEGFEISQLRSEYER
jgi:hypothetical protein